MAASDITRGTVVQIPIEELGAYLENIEGELSGGRSIELVRGETVIAEMRAPQTEPVMPASRERVLPDFTGRMKAIWGDKVFPDGYMTQIIREDRDARG